MQIYMQLLKKGQYLVDKLWAKQCPWETHIGIMKWINVFTWINCMFYNVVDTNEVLSLFE